VRRSTTGARARLPDTPPEIWANDWIWGVPLIVVVIVLHVAGLSLIHRLVEMFPVASSSRRRREFRPFVMGGVALLTTLLHGLEAAVWGLAYFGLGALPNIHDAMLFSLDSLTTYGHDTLTLERQWQMMGALEALNGILAFGLTTAFLFFQMRRLWPSLSVAASHQPEHERPSPPFP
jgi:hypothetical protein